MARLNPARRTTEVGGVAVGVDLSSRGEKPVATAVWCHLHIVAEDGQQRFRRVIAGAKSARDRTQLLHVDPDRRGEIQRALPFGQQSPLETLNAPYGDAEVPVRLGLL